jgi:hypothetical protein
MIQDHVALMVVTSIRYGLTRNELYSDIERYPSGWLSAMAAIPQGLEFASDTFMTGIALQDIVESGTAICTNCDDDCDLVNTVIVDE